MQKKVVLVDGNNLLFRSYFATAYTGNVMRNSKGFPTNALYGFVGMINKIINEENPTHMVVAFDIGKNFRKQEYSFYKEGRNATPDELKMQMPYARKILEGMGICYKELEPYEADDIIGTISLESEKNPEYYTLIVSSDKDLLQLISDETEVKLLKQSGFIRFNKETFINEYGIDPIRMIDLKSLMGDQSDNIPGVKGIGEKTALKLLQEYNTIDGIYENIDSVKGKNQEKLINDKENAYMSYKLATIYREVPINVDFEEFKYLGPNEKLKEIYEELEFYSLMKTIKIDNNNLDDKFIVINNIDEIKLSDKVSYYLEVDNYNYHFGNPLMLSITTSSGTYIVKKELIKDALKLIKDKNVYTYDLKKTLVSVSKDIFNPNIIDTMVVAYLLNYNYLEDINSLMNEFNIDIIKYDTFKKNNFEDIEKIISKKSKFIYEYGDKLYNELDEDLLKVYKNIEYPLINVLANMEINGFKYDASVNKEMIKEVEDKLESIKKEIYTLTGYEFNISSPKQLGDILFDKLEIGKGSKNKNGFKTDEKTLSKYESKYPVISKILEYRNLSKLYSTYLISLNSYVLNDGKIHTIFNQTLTRTGRLSSSEPNLQNIPVREDYGKLIRKSFVAENDLLISADYSQIELRLLAHMSNSKELINAFINGEDIHSKVASDIYDKDISEVTKKERSLAKAVIFGIVYGISNYGLSENTNLSPNEAKEIINKYYSLYPGIREFMESNKKYAYDNGYVKTMFGRIRNIEELKSSNFHIRSMGERMAYNTPIQGTCADIMKLAMIRVFNKMNEMKLRSKMILQVHDEIIIDAYNDEEEIINKILYEEMENVIKLSVPLKIEINKGSNWYLAK